MVETSRQRITRASLNALTPTVLGRLLLAASGLVALKFDPPQFSVAPEWVLPALFAYAAFALFALGQEMLDPSPRPALDWLDLAWGVLLTVLTGGTSSVLFFFLLLPIIGRSFRDGFEAGWKMTLCATGAFLLCGLPASPGGVLFEFNRSLTRPLTLIILGYVIAREGGVQRRQRRQLELRNALDTVSNPRFGVERTLVNAAVQIRAHYGVQACLILLAQEANAKVLLVRALADRAESEWIPRPAMETLLAIPERAGLLHAPPRSLATGEGGDALAAQAQTLADLLHTRALLSVPVGNGGACSGRVFVLDERLSQFGRSELQFLSEAARHLHLILEKVDLLERLASLAAQRERRRLASDLHDRAIQPYVGLQLGLTAALRRPGVPDAVAEDLRNLLSLADQGASELRDILAGQRTPGRGVDILEDSLSHMVTTLRHPFGIELAFERDPALNLSDRLATDVLAMIQEGVSNVRRHTASGWVRVELRADGDMLDLSIHNARAPETRDAFLPRSLHERARALGGDLMVESEGPRTTIHIRVPQ